MRQPVVYGLVALILTTGCQGSAVASGSAASASPVAKAPAQMTVRRAFSHVHVSGAAEADAKTVVCRTEAELTAALKERGLDQLPEGPETVAKAAKSVDFAKETAILVDQGLVPSMTQTVEPIEATETPQGVTVRYKLQHSDIDLPALNRPYAILAIPKTDKPVTVEKAS